MISVRVIYGTIGHVRICNGQTNLAFRCTGGTADEEVLLVTGMFRCCSCDARTKSVHLTVSSAEGDRLTAKLDVQLRAATAVERTSFRIDDSVQHQKIDGFGAHCLESGCICLNTLPKPEQEKVLQALLHLNTGAGFSVMKTVIASTDFYGRRAVL